MDDLNQVETKRREELTFAQFNSVCSICLVDIEPENDLVVVLTKCKHVYHGDCWQTMWAFTNECPYCIKCQQSVYVTHEYYEKCCRARYQYQMEQNALIQENCPNDKCKEETRLISARKHQFVINMIKQLFL